MPWILKDKGSGRLLLLREREGREGEGRGGRGGEDEGWGARGGFTVHLEIFDASHTIRFFWEAFCQAPESLSDQLAGGAARRLVGEVLVSLDPWIFDSPS